MDWFAAVCFPMLHLPIAQVKWYPALHATPPAPDVAFIIERAEHQHAFEYFTDTKLSTLPFYGTLQPMYRCADYLSALKCASNRRLVSRFRTGCHGLQVDTDRWANNVSTGTGCLVCKSLGCVEDMQHLIFDCPAYSHIRAKHVDLFQHCCTVADFMSLCEPNAWSDAWFST